MGNNIKEEISQKFYEMKSFIECFNYEKSYEIYQTLKSELIKIQDVEDINEISDYLIENHIQKNIGYKFRTLIKNLRPNDKLDFLFQLLYENELVESIEYNIEKNNFNSLIIKKEKIDKNNIEQVRKDINIKLNRINNVYKFIKLFQFKSILYEKIADKYYNLGSSIYLNYCTKKNQKSNELQEVVDLFTNCINYYQKTNNQKTKLEEYSADLEKVKAHQNILKGREYINGEKFFEALKCFENINCNISNIIEEKNKGIHFCYEKLAEIEEEKQNYEKAIEYYMLIDNNFKINELHIKINYILIYKYIKEKKYEISFSYFNNVFDIVKKAQNREFIELKYSSIFITFIELTIKLAIDYYQANKLKDYIENLTIKNVIIDNEGIKSQINQLLQELKFLEKNNKNNYFEYLKKSLNLGKTEIKQRFNLSFLIDIYFKINPLEVISILLRKDIKLEHLTSKSFNILIEYLKGKNNINDLFLISKLINKIIVNFGRFQKIEYLNIIMSKIKEINEIPNIDKDIKYKDVIEFLIFSFQEILINNNRIKNYNGPKIIICSLILKSSVFIDCTSRCILFLSKKGIIFEKNIIYFITSYLIKKENDNLLETLFIQCKLEPKIINDHLNSIYHILFFYQNNLKNKNGGVAKIFNFLISLPDELISSRISIINLEKYITEMEIDPLCYRLIEKIPISSRTIKLTNILSKFYEKKNNNSLNIIKEDNSYQFNFMSIITKDDLPQIEVNLDKEFYVEKLIYYLKSQKYLFNYLNLEEICKHFSSSKRELFNLLINNETKFDEKALTNLLCGFYKNSEEEIKITFDLFYKIKQYQFNFPISIEANLKIEEFLYKKEYKTFKSFDIKLNEIFNDFSYLNGFANQHQKFILYLLNLSEQEKKKEIFERIKTFLVDKNYDIGVEIYQEFLKNINQNEFVKIIYSIFSSKKISTNIKKMTKEKLYILLIESDNKLELLKSFKKFIDFIKLPDNLLEYLIVLLQNDINAEMHKEIIFILGNYFSTNKKKQQQFLNNVISLISKKPIYKFIINKISIIKSKKDILYLYSCLNYVNFNIAVPRNEREILEIPISLIVDIIKSFNTSLNKKVFYENLNILNSFYNYNNFSPQRDKILRKLFFNNKKNPVNKLLLICC